MRALGRRRRAARREQIFAPYHDAHRRRARRAAARGPADDPGRAAQLHAGVHGRAAALAVGVLYNRDAAPGAQLLLALLRPRASSTVGDNAALRGEGCTDYTVPVHAERRGLPHVEIEIRQDLIADEAGRSRGRSD